MASLKCHALRLLSPTAVRRQISFIQTRTYSSGNDVEAEFEAAREWFRTFKKSSIPAKIAETEFIRSSGAGGQKVNKTSSKATTKWPLQSLLPYLPKVLHREIQNSRYYVASSNSLRIDSDTHRNQTKNKEDTHERLFEEIKKLYAKTVPGVTAPETRKKIEALKKVENTVRLKMKKMHGDKKRARSGGGSRGGD